MAGVLFIIWVPCERYEQILSHKQIWETTATTSRKLPEQLATSSSEDEINYSNAKVSHVKTEHVLSIYFVMCFAEINFLSGIQA